MYYQKCKVYTDGGHYIAIQPTTRPYSRKRLKSHKKFIDAIDQDDNTGCLSAYSNRAAFLLCSQHKILVPKSGALKSRCV